VANAPPAAGARSAAPAKRPLVFYGWWIVLGAILAQFIAMGQNQSTNLILGPMTQEFGWTRSQFILPTSVGVLISGFLGFFVGAQVDRRGARPLLVIGAFISSTALILLAYVQELWQFWVLRGVVLVLGNVMVGNLVVNITVSKWFVDRRGWAISMAALGVSGWSVLGTQLLRPVVDIYGWRAGWITLGFATWALFFIAMLMRRQPEDYGLLPDGRTASDEHTEHGRAAIQRAARDLANSFTRGEAARTPQLWLLVLAFGFALTGMTALFAHMLQFFVDAGFTRTEAAFFYSTQGGFSLLAKFIWGGAMQRLPARMLVAVAFSIAGSATLGMVLLVDRSSWQVVAALSAAWGLGTGGMIPLSEFVWASYFGRRHIGAVRGLGMPFTVMLTSAGPLFASEVFDRTGSYDIAFLTFVGMWFTGAMLILVARRPRRVPDFGVPLAHRLRQPEPPPHAAMAALAVEREPVAEPRAESQASAPPVAPPAPSVAEAPAVAAGPAAPPVVAGPRRRLPPRSYMGEAPSVPPRPVAAAPPPPPRPLPPPVEAVEPPGVPEPEPASWVEVDEDREPVVAAVRPFAEPEAVRVAEVLTVPPPPPPEPPRAAPSPEPPRAAAGAAHRASAPSRPPAADWRGAPPRHPRPATPRQRAVERPPRREVERRLTPRSPYLPPDTATAVLAGVATSIVATAALWFLTRGDGRSSQRRS
jgi:MFS family permease